MRGNTNIVETIKNAADKVGLELDQVLDLLKDVKNGRRDGLAMTNNGDVVVWFKVNAKNLVSITEKIIQSDTN